MNAVEVAKYITKTFAHVNPADAWGDTFFYYNPDTAQPDTVYFATLKGADDDYDNASNLNRPDVFRLNIGITKPTFIALFGEPKLDIDKSGAVDSRFDFAALDQLLPHPVYGRLYWVCVLNPSDATFQTIVQPLLAEAYQLAISKYDKRAARDQG